MKLAIFLILMSCFEAGAFETETLKKGEGLRIEVVEFVLPAAEAAPIIDTFDGSDLSAAACYKKFTQAGHKPQKVYRKILAAGNNEFETSFEETGKNRPLLFRLIFHRDELQKRIWTYGFVTPNYRVKEGQYAGELSMNSSGVTAGAIKFLSVVPDSLDVEKYRRVRVLFSKLSARDAAVAAFPEREADKVSVGVFASEVTVPFADYERLAKMKLKAVELKQKLLELDSAKVTGLFGGETLDGGRVRQRSATKQELPAEPTTTNSNLFDCDASSLAQWKRQGADADADGQDDPPIGAKGILIDWFNWRRNLPRPEPVVTRVFRWNEDWKNPGVIVEETRSEGMIDAAAELMCVLPDKHPYLAAVAIIGKKGGKDRRAMLLFVRGYERPL